MTSEDLAEVMRIEEVSFSTPWSKGMFLTELRDNPFSNLLVARGPARPGEHPRGRVVGYCCFWLLFGEVHIMNLAVDPASRREGIARRLVEDVLRVSRENRVSSVHLEVRKSNDAARLLYEHLGFKAVGIRRNYYDRPREDALLMALKLQGAS